MLPLRCAGNELSTGSSVWPMEQIDNPVKRKYDDRVEKMSGLTKRAVVWLEFDG